jgi:hypothetical protein
MVMFFLSVFTILNKLRNEWMNGWMNECDNFHKRYITSSSSFKFLITFSIFSQSILFIGRYSSSNMRQFPYQLKKKRVEEWWWKL